MNKINPTFTRIILKYLISILTGRVNSAGGKKRKKKGGVNKKGEGLL